MGGSAKRPSIELVAVASGDFSAASLRRRQRSGELLPPPPPLLLEQHHAGSSTGEPPSLHGTSSCAVGKTRLMKQTHWDLSRRK